MKKAMIALAGIVSVMMLASCQKEVEIDGDVSLEKTGYEYAMDVVCTDATVASPKETNSDGDVTKWDTPVVLRADTGSIEWDDYKNSNVKEYELRVKCNGKINADERKLELSYVDLIKCKDSWYLEDVLDANKVTVTGSPEDSSFTVTAKNWIKYGYSNSDVKRYNFTLKFTRK